MKNSITKIVLWITTLIGISILVGPVLIGIQRKSTSTFNPQNDNPLTLQLHQILQKEMVENGFNGSVLITRGDQILLNDGYGYASRYLDQKEITPDTRFLLGSMTKTFTALAILQLEEDQLVNLDDSITTYFPEYTGWEQVTIHHMLNHTSGIPNYYESFSDHVRYFLGHTTPLQIMDRFKNTPLQFLPGSEFDYSNTNYMVLSAIIEQVSGQKYIDYLNQHILTPMGLADTGYSELTGSVSRLARGYCLDLLIEVTGFNLSNFYGAGGLYSTTGDLYQLQKHIDYKKLINQQSTANIKSEYDYGYGMMVTEEEGFGTTYFISGGGPGINTVMYKVVAEDISVIILSNNQEFDTEALAVELIHKTLAR